jgi:hypothetical protein
MACAYHSGFFIASGGTSSKNQTEGLYPSQPIVYDVNKDQWVDYYSLPSAVGGNEDGSDRVESSPEEKSHMGIIIGAGVGGIVVMMICAVVLGYMVQKRRRDKKAAERDARTLAILSDGEDHYSYRRRTMHKKAAASARNNISNNRVMTAAEHYAAAQAATELQAARVRDAPITAAIAAGSGEEIGERRTNSWYSDTFSQIMASEKESSMLLMNVDKARRISDVPTCAAVSAGVEGGGGADRVQMDSQTYNLHLLHQQRKLQSRHPELLLGDNSDNKAAAEAVPTTAVGFFDTGLVQQQQQQSDRVRRSPHSTPDEKDAAETLLGGNSSSTAVGGGEDGSPTTTKTGSGAEKAISFTCDSSSSYVLPTTSARRGPHSLQ